MSIASDHRAGIGKMALVEDVLQDDQVLIRQHNLIRSMSLDHLRQMDIPDE